MSDDEITHTDTLPPADYRVIDGRYRLVERLGVGGMGEVFAAEHLLTGQPVAIKRMYAFGPLGELERFRQEVRTSSRVDHPGVVDVIDAGQSADGVWYLVMERLDGQSLDRWMIDDTRTIDAQLALVRALLEPLAAVHAADIVHRDLKPDNVFVLPDGSVKIIDFGIARDLEDGSVTRTGSTMGTPHYMSPEQAMDPRTCTPASDVWSIGVLLYRMTTGRLPFEGNSFPAVCMKAIQDPHPPITGLHPALVGLIDRCLDKEPTRRPADAAALMEAWDALPAGARRGEQAAVVSKRPRSRLRWMAVAGLTGVTLAVAVAIGVGGEPAPPDPTTRVASPAPAPVAADAPPPVSAAEPAEVAPPTAAPATPAVTPPVEASTARDARAVREPPGPRSRREARPKALPARIVKSAAARRGPPPTEAPPIVADAVAGPERSAASADAPAPEAPAAASATAGRAAPEASPPDPGEARPSPAEPSPPPVDTPAEAPPPPTPPPFATF